MKRALSHYLSKIMIITLVALGFLQPVYANTTEIKKKPTTKKSASAIAKKGKAADRYALLNE